MSAVARVLVVDDDPLVRRVVVRMIERLEFVVLEAEGLTAARATLAREKVDLVLCDVDLQDGSGVDLAAELLAAKDAPRVMLMSGSDPVLAHARETLGVMVMSKPFDRAGLQAMLGAAGLMSAPSAQD